MNKSNAGAGGPDVSIRYPLGEPSRRQPRNFSWHACPTVLHSAELSVAQRGTLQSALENLFAMATIDERKSVDVLTQLAVHLLHQGWDIMVGLSLVEGIELGAMKFAVLAGHSDDHGHVGMDPASSHVSDPRLMAMVDVKERIACVYQPQVALEFCPGCVHCS